VQFEELPGLSPITTVGRFATAEEAQAATDAGCGATMPSTSRLPTECVIRTSSWSPETERYSTLRHPRA
jgi:hypothetical protein